MARVALSGNEFVSKILSGEKDFKNISLEEHFDLSAHPKYNQLNAYLREHSQSNKSVGEYVRLDRTPSLELSGASLHGFRAVGERQKGLYFHRIWAHNADFTGAELSGAIFSNAWMTCANFTKASLREVFFQYALLGESSFVDADLTQAYFGAGDLGKTDMTRAKWDGTFFDDVDMRGIKGLRTATILNPQFHYPRVDAEVAAAIKEKIPDIQY